MIYQHAIHLDTENFPYRMMDKVFPRVFFFLAEYPIFLNTSPYACQKGCECGFMLTESDYTTIYSQHSEKSSQNKMFVFN